MISIAAVLSIKKREQKDTKQTGQCLTLSSVRLDLLSCCCFCPSFWAKFLHAGVHSTALTSLLGHELSCLWDMNRTWPRAQITERQEERPDSKGLQLSFLPPPLCSLVNFLLFLLSTLLLRAPAWLVKMNLHARRGKRTVVSPAWTAQSCAENWWVSLYLCMCVVLDETGM